MPLARVRFFERGTGAVWLPSEEKPVLSENAETVRATIAAEGALFIGDIQAITGLTMLSLREAIRELVAWGLVTNDTVEALRDIARWKPMMPRTGPDPTSWLPADYTPSPNRRSSNVVPIFGVSRNGDGRTDRARRQVAGPVAGRWCVAAEPWGQTFLRKKRRSVWRGSGLRGMESCHATGGVESGRPCHGARSTAS